MSSSHKKVVGIASDFFVILAGSWIETYDEKCKKITTISSSNKQVRGAAGSTFIVKSGSWIETYDRNCKKTGTRAA